MKNLNFYKMYTRHLIFILFVTLVFAIQTRAQTDEKSHSQLHGLLGFPSYSFDTGWLGADVGIGIYVKFGGSIGGTLAETYVNGKGVLDHKSNSQWSLKFNGTSGQAKMVFGLQAYAKYKLVVPIYGTYKDDLPFLPNADFSWTDNKNFTPYLFNSTVKLSDSFQDQPIIEKSIGVASVIDLHAGIVLSSSATNTISGDYINSSAGSFNSNTITRNLNISGTSYTVNSIYEKMKSDLTFSLTPKGTIGVTVLFTDYSLSVPFFKIPISVPEKTFSTSSASLTFNTNYNSGNSNNTASKFIQVASSSNRSSNSTYINNTACNGKSDALVFVTPNLSPNSGSGEFNNSPIGVWYNGSKWAIFNQNRSGMPQGAAFNVFVTFPGSNAFVHTATSSNTANSYTFLDNPRLNGNPNAIFIVTQNWNPPGGKKIYNNAPIGVAYDGTHWSIFNESNKNMPIGAAFNVYIPSSTNDVLVLSSNTQRYYSTINNSLLNSKKDAIFFTTQLWNRGGRSNGIWNNTPSGVMYNTSSNRWAVFNQNKSSIPPDAAFNIFVSNSITDVENNGQNELTKEYTLYQNYPNPFNPTTNIEFSLPKQSHVRIDVYNTIGQRVKSLVNGELSAGKHIVTFNASGLSSGVYLYRLQAGDFIESRKLMLMK